MEARRTRKIMFYLKFARHGGLLHEHELYEMLRSRKLYNIQCDLRRHLQRTIKSLECDERVSMAAIEARRTHFLQSTARRERAKTGLTKVKDFFPEGVNRDGSLGGDPDSPPEEACVAGMRNEQNRQFESVDPSVGSETSAEFARVGKEKVEKAEDESLVFKTRLPDSYRDGRPKAPFVDIPTAELSMENIPPRSARTFRQMKAGLPDSSAREDIFSKDRDPGDSNTGSERSSNGRSENGVRRNHHHQMDQAIVVRTIPLLKIPTSQLTREEVLEFVRGSQCTCDECVNARSRGKKQHDFLAVKSARRTATKLPPLPEKPLTRGSTSLVEAAPECRRRTPRVTVSESEVVENTERFKALRLSRLEDVRRRSRDLQQQVAQFRLHSSQ